MAKAGLRFSAPADWTVLDPEKFGVGVDILVGESTPTDGFMDNINIVMTRFAELPTGATLRAQLPAATSGPSTPPPVGKARLIEVEMPLPDGSRSFGSSLYVRTDKGIANLTVTAREMDDSQQLLNEILPTLSTTG